MKINTLDDYTYDFFEDTCKLLNNGGFTPRRILDIGANVCQTADVFRQFWPASDITTLFYKTKFHPLCSGNSIYKEINPVYEGDSLITETLSVHKLDDVVTGTYDLIKIDTQGSELDIIKGGINTFGKAKVVICEVALIDINIGGCKKEDVMNILTKELKFDYIRCIERITNGQQITYENLLFIQH